METMEIVVYMGIALIIGGMLVAVIAGWDARETFQGFTRLFKDDAGVAYEKIPDDAFPREVLQTWEACGLGTTDGNRTIYVTGNVSGVGEVSKAQLFAYIKAAGICRSLQSAALGCGEREDVVFTSKATPAVVRIECRSATRTLVIS
jgi:hypothetical protein